MDNENGIPNGSLLATDDDGKRDGKWFVTQEYGSCSKACGGGIMTMKRICIPPINGGKECVGSTWVEKPCNIEPCEEGKINAENGLI